MSKRPNKLSSGTNMLWESSRMMLPEHKKRLSQHHKQLQHPYMTKPLLDEQRLEELAHSIAVALSEQRTVRMLIYDDGTARELEGVLEHANPHLRRVKLQCRDAYVWIPLDDILHIEL